MVPVPQSDEVISHTYHNIYGMSLTGLRFFTVYGPWGRPDMAAFKFAKNILMGDNITVFQVRLRIRMAGCCRRACKRRSGVQAFAAFLSPAVHDLQPGSGWLWGKQWCTFRLRLCL